MSQFPCHKCDGQRFTTGTYFQVCPECEGTGIDPWPWTGFTIEIDGEQDAVRRVYRAAQAEMEKILKERDNEPPDFFMSPIRTVYRHTLWPFHGRLGFRDDRVDMQNWPV